MSQLIQSITSPPTRLHTSRIVLPLSRAGWSRHTPPSLTPKAALTVATDEAEVHHWLHRMYGPHLLHPTEGEPSRDEEGSLLCTPSVRLLSRGYDSATRAALVQWHQQQKLRQPRAAAGWASDVDPLPPQWFHHRLIDGSVFSLQEVAPSQPMVGSVRLPPLPAAREAEPLLYAVDDSVQTWAVWPHHHQRQGRGGTSPVGLLSHHAKEVQKVLEAAMAGAMLSAYEGVWLRAAGLCGTDGSVVLIMGPPDAGKRTLALHCLSSFASSQRSGWALSATTAPLLMNASTIPSLSNTDDELLVENPLVVMSLPSPIDVRLGSILGTLLPNPALSRAALQQQDLPSTLTWLRQPKERGPYIAALLRNKEEVLWRMSPSVSIPLHSIFSPTSIAWSPAAQTRIRGVVMLNWDVSSSSSGVRRLQPAEGLQHIADHPDLDSFLQYDHTVGTVCRAVNTQDRLMKLLQLSPPFPVISLEGAVDYERGVQEVDRLFANAQSE